MWRRDNGVWSLGLSSEALIENKLQKERDFELCMSIENDALDGWRGWVAKREGNFELCVNIEMR